MNLFEAPSSLEDLGFDPTRQIKVFRNGDHSKSCETILKGGITFKDLGKTILHQLGLRDTGLFRLFTNEGLELHEDDIPLIRDGDHLFISQGEGFDQKTSLAEYKEICSLGQGGFGKVFLVEHIKTNQRYAVKYVDSRKYGNKKSINSSSNLIKGLASYVDMVFKEAELLKNLNHKNIVQITNFFTLKDMRVVFLMEYLEGGELGVYLKKKGRLDEPEALDIFLQLLDAVEFCHLNNIIHRDLKLENILFTSKGGNQIKVVDFGIAGFYSGMGESESNAGSLKYMAPEILTGANSAANPAIDVWSMGVILYALLSGHLPFTGSTRHEIKSKIISGNFQIDSDVKKRCSLECMDFLTRMLIVNTKVRITTAEMKKHPWLAGGKLPTVPSWIELDDPTPPLSTLEDDRTLQTKIYPKTAKSKKIIICSASANCTPNESFYDVKEKKVVSRVTSLRASSIPRESLVMKAGFRLLTQSQSKKDKEFPTTTIATAMSASDIIKKKESIFDLKKRETPPEHLKRKEFFNVQKKEDRFGITPEKIRVPETSSLGNLRAGPRKITLPSIKLAASFITKVQLSARGSKNQNEQ